MLVVLSQSRQSFLAHSALHGQVRGAMLSQTPFGLKYYKPAQTVPLH